MLLVEDDTDISMLLSFRLKAAGYNVVSFADGFAVIEEIEKNRPDMILLDLNIPGLSGRELCAGLKAREQTADIPVIILSAFAGGLKEISDVCGADDYLAKPYEASHLFKKMEKYLRGGSSEKEAGGDFTTLPAAKYISHRKEDMLQIKKFMQNSDGLGIANLGHKMRGSGTLYGFKEISKIGSAFEKAGKAGDFKKIGEILERLKKYISELKIS